MEGLTEGRIVHYVMPNGDHRPAIVVNTWPDVAEYQRTGTVNMQVFTDGRNDNLMNNHAISDPDYSTGLYWATSVLYSEGKEPGTWHWIERA